MAYKEYPRHVHKAAGVHCVVHSDAERDAKVAEGWALQPVPADAPLTRGGEPEAPAPDPVAETLTKRRGRPKKAARSGEGDDPTDRGDE
jgi:hypothetical protein